METLAFDRTLTEIDHTRLSRLIRSGVPSRGDTKSIESILDSALLVPSQDISPEIGRQKKLTVCYPEDARPSDGFVSVLSPAGSSLLGLRVGDLARWRTPTGDEGTAEVVAILFQPEASGDYTT
jgi:regulator of nucleoside diphosphate kinase